MWELFLALIVGVIFGTFTGIFPGIHINLVAAGLLALIGAGSFAGIEPIILAVFVVAMAITHTFIDFIPSVFLGAPEEDSFLAVLPGHELLKKGRGFDAVVATLYGSLAALPFIFIFSFIFIWKLSSLYDFVLRFIPLILIFASLYLIFREDNFWKSLVVFLMAGVLGLMALNLPVKEPLLPMLTGLFGVSTLIVSLKDKVQIPEQKISRLKIPKFIEIRRTFLTGGIVAPFFSFLPAIGSGQAAVIASEIAGKEEKDEESFLFLVGMINTIVMALSFVTLYVIGRARTGAAVAVGKILEEINFESLVLILMVVFVAGFCAFFVGIFLGKFFARNIWKVNYRKISIWVLVLLGILNLILTNWIGLIVLITGSALGIFCILTGTRRINLMGCLLVPTIVFYLRL